MISDSVADALIRIKNGYLSRKEEVVIRYSKLVENVCGILTTEGYLEVVTKDGERSLIAKLKYNNKRAAVSDLKRVSKPGLRIYKSKKALPYVLNGLGIAIISTPKGLMTDKQARKEGLGGEVMAYVW